MASPIRRLIRNRLGYARHESTLSPAELYDLVRRKPMQRQYYSAAKYCDEKPLARFVKEAVSDEFMYFRSDNRPSNLLICFTDKHSTLFQSIPEFLQTLGDKDFDVIVLHDRRRYRHSIGLKGLTGSLRETLDLVQSKIADRGYDRLFTYGTSMGGFTAIRAGLLVGADRAVSVGGSFIDIPKYFDNGGKFFNPRQYLCSCDTNSKTEIVMIYSQNCYPDVQNALHMRSIFPECWDVRCDSEKHDIFRQIKSKGFIRNFLMSAFFDDDISGEKYDDLVFRDKALQFGDADKREKLTN